MNGLTTAKCTSRETQSHTMKAAKKFWRSVPLVKIQSSMTRYTLKPEMTPQRAAWAKDLRYRRAGGRLGCLVNTTAIT